MGLRARGSKRQSSARVNALRGMRSEIGRFCSTWRSEVVLKCLCLKGTKVKIPKRYLINPRDSIRAEKAAILWAHDSEHRVRNVYVIEHPIREESRWYHGSGGACFANWLFKNGPEKDDGFSSPCLMSPEGTFGLLAACGFADQHELQNAILQFARISSCHWAQAALHAFTDEQERTIRAEAERRRELALAEEWHRQQEYARQRREREAGVE